MSTTRHDGVKCIVHAAVLSIWITSLVLRPGVAIAQQGEPKVADFALPGERIVTLSKPIMYKGRVYEIHLLTTGAFDDKKPDTIWVASQEYFERRQISALLVTADGVVVEDEATAREILTLYRAAFEAYEHRALDYLGYVDDTFVDDFRAITRNPVFVEQQIKAIFTSRGEQTADALRGILTPQVAAPDDIKEFSDQVREGAEQLGEFPKAIDLTVEAARFSNNKEVRELGKDAKDIFKSWNKVTEQGRSFVDVGGKRVEFFNALDILSLSMRLIWLADLQQERAEWIENYVDFAVSDGALDAEQVSAARLVTVEAHDQWMQRSTIVLGFVRDTTVDLGVRLSEQVIVDKWVEWSWNQFGKRLTGHLVAGAASAVLLGFTIGNILYGLDDLFTNFKAGERADDLRRKFRATRLALEEEAGHSSNERYSGELAAKYRVAYMLEALAAAQMYRSYSDGVDATVRKGLLALVNPVAWFKGNEWREATQELRGIADTVEENAENELGHPALLDSAIALMAARLSTSMSPHPTLVEEADPSFSRSGPAEYWQTTSAGHAGASIWTYCDAKATANSARWTSSAVRPGMYQVQAFIPSHQGAFPKPFTRSAQYRIVHAGTTNSVTGNQAATGDAWLDLGSYYFDGTGGEYVELVDFTGERSGSTIVVFDAVQWLPAPSNTPLRDAMGPDRQVYDVVLAGEMVNLGVTVRNTGQAPWYGAAYSLDATSPLPDGAPRTLTLGVAVAPGDTASWTISFPMSGAPGIRRLSYHMHFNGQPFGAGITVFVIVLPAQLQSAEQRIRDRIEDWQRQGEQAVDDLMQRIWVDIQRELEQQAQNFVEKLLSQCTGATAMLGAALAVAYTRRRRL